MSRGGVVKMIVLGGIEWELYDGHVCALIALAELVQLSFGKFILPSEDALHSADSVKHIIIKLYGKYKNQDSIIHSPGCI